MSRQPPALRRLVAALLPALLLAGCTAPTGGGGGGGGRGSRTAAPAIAEFHVVPLPVALNLDALPGPDGFAVKLFAVGPKEPKSVRIARGSVELQLFDGVLQGGDAAVRPIRTWTLTPDQLKEFEQEAVIGVHYQFTLRWETPTPTGERVPVVGAYRDPEGRVVPSAPAVITVSSGP